MPPTRTITGATNWPVWRPVNRSPANPGLAKGSTTWSPEMPEQREQERICLFGGTFDPIHIAHLRIANEALKNFSLNRVLFIPAACPPHKNGQIVTPFEDRFRMVEIACAPYPSFVPSRLEVGDRPNYTIDTVE